MHSVTIRGAGGCVLLTADYASARARLFPHADQDYLPSPWPWKRQRISRCDECVRARTEWIESHQQPNKSLQATATAP